jgi:succinate dehydrogenase / fumarate reductase, flavoprotein subunit
MRAQLVYIGQRMRKVSVVINKQVFFMESINGKAVHHQACNVLVIGAGAAGLRAAIEAHLAGAEVNIVGKRQKKDAHTVLAAGGINAAFGNVDPEDSWQQHFIDTRKEGYFIADPLAVETLCKYAPKAVQTLAEWGCPFAHTKEGKLDQRYFGAHKWRRTCYAGDWTGRAILHTLVGKVEELGLNICENQYVWKLLTTEGECFGALSFDIFSGDITVHQADCVILATGGHTRLWRHSSSRQDENTGDGMHLAMQEGVALADMEFVQFHPTGMTHPKEWVGTLVTEAVRGEGGYLRNREGDRFMKKYDPKRMELSTRDLVALANYKEIMEGRGGANGGVFLDITHLDKRVILEKLPRMYRQFIEAQLIDISKEWMEVAPTAHYSMGGIVVDPLTHETSIKGLFAAGEVTSGVHGANRLGGNSLAETIVFGEIVGKRAAESSLSLSQQPRSPTLIKESIKELKQLIREGEEYARPLQRALRVAMWEKCGVVRSADQLKEGLKELAEIEKRSTAVDVRPSSEGYKDLVYALDLRSSLLAAKVTFKGALAREESRGAHQREDFPNTCDQMLTSFRAHLKNGEITLTSHSIPPIPSYLKTSLQEDYDLEDRLLE